MQMLAVDIIHLPEVRKRLLKNRTADRAKLRKLAELIIERQRKMAVLERIQGGRESAVVNLYERPIR